MSKYFFAVLCCILCFASYGQLNTKAIKKNFHVYDCVILETVFKDSTIFKRKDWAKKSTTLIINDFNNYFRDCPELQLYNRKVVLIHKELEHRSDTLTILYVTKKKENEYDIDIFHPRSGNDVRVALLKEDGIYRVLSSAFGAY